MATGHDTLFIGGEWVAPSSPARIDVLNASTGELTASVPEASEADADAAVAAARRAFDDPSGWSSWEPARRASALERLAAELEARAQEIGRAVSLQNGMPIALSPVIEGMTSVGTLRYMASLLGSSPVEEEMSRFLGGDLAIRHEPVGVIAGIVPWNYPQTLSSFKYAPALAAGNAIVLKPSPEALLDSYLLAEAVIAAGLPPGVVSIVPGGRDLGAYLVRHPGVDKVAFTGSTAAGRHIGETCGRLLRPVSLELGGKSAAIILDDADLDLARIGQDLFAATLVNNGQTCYACTRILAPRSRYSEVVDTLVALASSLPVGDALEPATMIGPLVAERQRDRVERYIAKGLSDGARLVTGGGRPPGLDQGWFVEPTIFADVDNESTIAQEEIFGPVLSVIEYTDDDQAIAIANDSDYGLAGSVWTADPDRARQVARRIRTGTVGINGFQPDPAGPWGGVKSSGLGRELGPGAIAAYQNLKTFYA